MGLSERNAIVTAATQILADQGEGSLTMRRLAEASGLAATTLYHYFDCKADIIDEVRVIAISRVASMIDEVRTVDHRNALVDFGMRLVLFASRDPSLYRLITASPCGPTTRSTAFADQQAKILEWGTSRLRALGVPDERIDEAYTHYWWALHGMAMYSLENSSHGKRCDGQPLHLQSAAASYAAYVVDGIVAAHARAATPS